MSDVEGKIAQLNDKGMKLEGHEGWYNFTRPEWREEPWDENFEVGNHVQLGLDKGGKFIRSIQILSVHDAPNAFDEEMAPPNRDRIIAREVALKAAVEYLREKASTDREVIAVATNFEEWVLRG